MSEKTDNIDLTISAIIEAEQKVDAELAQLKTQYQGVFDALDKIQAQRDEIERMKAEVKDALVTTEDFDLHKVKGYKISVCPVVKFAVGDEDLVEDKYKSTEVVVDTKKAQEHKKLYGKTPAGFIDRTYYRLTWKEDDNAKKEDD